jgi:HK97 family phage portal protein
MTLIERLQIALRAFVTGQADVLPSDEAWGIAPSEWQPAEYVSYLATSNAIYTCCRKRSDALASLPIKVYRGSGDNKREVTTGPLYDLLHRVNPHWTFQRLLAMHEYSMCLWGEDYWFLERGQAGRQPPQEIWWARADQAYVYPDEDEYIKGYGYLPRQGGLPIAYLPQEVIAFRYPNPANQWRGLSPLAAARLAADSASAAMLSNRNIFANGVQLGGAIFPKNGVTFTAEQAKKLEQDIADRLKGVEKAHKWAVFRGEYGVEEMGITPKDAEFLGLLKWSLEDVCRAYNVPLDLVGGQRTYDNYTGANKALWTDAVIPAKVILEQELTEQLLPMFPGQAESVELDTSGVAVLKEDKAALWVMTSDQIKRGAITINEWRKAEGKEPVPWGDKPQAAAPDVPPVPADEMPPEMPPKAAPPKTDQTPRSRAMAAIPYNSAEHQRLWGQFVRSTESLEAKLTPVVVALFHSQQDAVLSRLKGRSARSVEDVADEPFDMARWLREFRERVRPLIATIIAEAGADALKELALSMSFDVTDPNVARFIEQRAQRFATEVNQTTWDDLKKSLVEGIGEGEDIPTLAARVEAVMGSRIESTPTTIARTEVIGGYNGGTLISWKQTDLRLIKTWLAALDDRTRPSHADAHGQTVMLDDDFTVGAGSGPAPGQIGIAGEDIACRCSMKATPLMPGESI